MDEVMNHVAQVPAIREQMLRLEDTIRAELQPVELKHKDYFSKGVYARELFIPKGTVLTGKIHKFTNLNIMSMGELSVLTDEGIKRVKAPFTIVSPPGTKRAAYAHEDTIWTTIHGTELTDVDEIERVFIAQSYQEFENFLAYQAEELANFVAVQALKLERN